MTIRLYYDDSYLREFPAEVLTSSVIGKKPAVTLDRTAFYPSSGGQPHDMGSLGSSRVVDVQETPEGEILHILDVPLHPGPVLGRIDWERRFDHMQQHTGQHVLSQAFVQVAGATTLSFHLGEERSTIDVGWPDPSESVLLDTERLANHIVFGDRMVRILKVDRSRLGELGVRKESQREGEIRVIDVEGFDRSPCGGTHVGRAGEIGLIFLLGAERYKGGARVEFVCGGRALKAFRQEHDILIQLGRIHSSHPAELPKLTEKLMQDRSALSRENARMTETILEMEAQELLGRADMFHEIRIVRRTYADRNLEAVKILAQKATAMARAVAILGIAHDPAQIALAKSKDVQGDCGQVVKMTAARFGGKGGGRPEGAQAGGINLAVLETWMQAVDDYFRGCITARQ